MDSVICEMDLSYDYNSACKGDGYTGKNHINTYNTFGIYHAYIIRFFMWPTVAFKVYVVYSLPCF